MFDKKSLKLRSYPDWSISLALKWLILIKVFSSPNKNVLNLQAETGKWGCKPAETLEHNHKVGESIEDVVVEDNLIKGWSKKLIYLSHTTPKIDYVVGL